MHTAITSDPEADVETAGLHYVGYDKPGTRRTRRGRGFSYRGDDGLPTPITSSDVNAYVRDTMGAFTSAKDFRTWGGTTLAAEHLAPIAVELTREAESAERAGRGHRLRHAASSITEPLASSWWRRRCATQAPRPTGSGSQYVTSR